MQFSDLKFRPYKNGLPGSVAKIDFPNGLGASVVIGPHTYGGDNGLYELGVTRGGKLTYDTPITEDVLGYLTEADVSDALARIAALPAAQEAAE